MAKSRRLPVSVVCLSIGAAVLLVGPPGALTATPKPRIIPEVHSAAFAGDIPWVVGLAGLGGTGNLGWTVGIAEAASTLQTANQLGPLVLDLDNVKTISLSQTPSPSSPTGSQPVFNAGDMTSWVVGLAGLGNSTGDIGCTPNNTFGSGNGGVAALAGTLDTSNQLGPMVFDLNVLKSITFEQPLNGTTLPDGQLDAIHAVDIGRWTAGIPGVIVNTGTTGFVTNYGYGVGLGTFDHVGGLHTTTQIGSNTFDFNFLPAISFPPFNFTPTGTLVNDPPPVPAPFAAGSTAAGPGVSAPGPSTSPSPGPSPVGFGPFSFSPVTLSPGTDGPRMNVPRTNGPSAGSSGASTPGTSVPGPGSVDFAEVFTGIMSQFPGLTPPSAGPTAPSAGTNIGANGDSDTSG